MRRTLLQGLRFASVGGVATVIHVLVAWLAVRAGSATPLWGNAAGFACAFGVSYAGHFRWTFAARAAHGASLPRFLTVALGGWGVSSALVWALAGGGRWGIELALVAVFLVVPPATWALSAAWAFRDRTTSPRIPR